MAALPYTDVDSTLRAISGQAEGFGRLAVGGIDGPLIPVTTLSNDGPGSLQEACRKPGPGWIVFEVSRTIQLSSYLNVSSHSTIDGRDERVKLLGKGLRLKECGNVIICNMEFEGGRGHDVDGIQIKPNSKNILIDRCSFKDYDDGLIDITRGSTDITVSRYILNATDMKLETRKKTFEFYTEKAAVKEKPSSGLIKSEGDLFLNGAQPSSLTDLCEGSIFHPTEYYKTWTMEAPSDSLKNVLQVCTGWQSIPRPVDRHIAFY